MFYYKYSKMTRRAIIFNAVVTSIIGLVHCYNAYRIAETARIINEYRVENQVAKTTAIKRLTDAGVSLYIGGEFASYFGILMAIITLILLYRFKSSNGFLITIVTATSCFISNVIGGAMLYYLMFSHKLESAESVQAAKRKSGKEKSEWEGFISNRAGSK